MRLISRDYKKGFVKLLITDEEDLWELFKIISEDDIIVSKTTRLIKKSDSKEGKRKPMTLKIRVTKTDWSGSELKILGVIIEGPEDVPRGSHHSFILKEGSKFKLIKDKWNLFEKSVINKSVKLREGAIIITLLDSKDNHHAVLKGLRVKHLSNSSSSLPRKDMPGYDKELIKFYDKTINQSINLMNSYKAELIIFAGPGFTPEELKNRLKEVHPELLKKSQFTKVSNVSKAGVNELVKGGFIKSIRQESKISKESELVSEFFLRLRKEKLIKYGFKEVKYAIGGGAGEVLLLSDELIREYRLRKEFKKIENLLYIAEQNNTRIEFVSTSHDLGKRFHKMGGVALLLRYNV
jgi:protein pelota